jgi:tetratricopeptide (TPR) repeat protein
MFTRPRFRIVCFSAVLSLLVTGSAIQAQHESTSGSKEIMGGGVIGGNTGRPTAKSPTKTTARPTAAVRKPATTTTTTTTRKPPVNRGPDANYYNTQGDQFYTAKNYKAALESYQKAVGLNPSLANAQYRIGWIQNDLEQYDEAIEPLMAATRLQQTAPTYYELGYAYRQLAKYDEALNAYNQCLRIKADHATANHDIGWIYNEQKNYEDAAKYLRQALSSDPNYADAHNELGYALRNLGRYSEAIEEYQEAIRLDPAMGLAHLGLGDVFYYNTRQYREAIKAYSEGVRLRPKSPTALYNLGLSFKAVGNRNGAMEQYRALQQIDAGLAQKLLTQINN